MQIAVTTVLMAGMAVPAAAMIASAPALVMDVRGRRRKSAVLQDHVARIIAAGRLIHELQRERGLSVAFLSKDNDDGALDSQRKLADAALKSFADQLPLNDQCKVLGAVVQAINGIPAHRGAIDSRSLAGPQAAAGYTGRIGALLDLTSLEVKSAARGRLAKLGSAYLNLLSAKEAAGQERALLTGILSASVVEPSSLRRAADLHQQQDMLLRLFFDGAGDELMLAAKNALADPDRVVNALRQAALSDAPDAHRPVPAMWFEAATRRIDALKSVEMRMEDQLTQAASGAGARAGRHLQMISVLTVAALGALGGMASFGIGG